MLASCAAGGRSLWIDSKLFIRRVATQAAEPHSACMVMDATLSRPLYALAPLMSAPSPRAAAAVDAARLLGANSEPGNWMSPGRTLDEQRFSPLRKINVDTVKQLGLAWFYDLDTAHRGQESTPLVIDGVMYVTSAWSKVFALDAKTGAPLWTFDPKVPGRVGVNACCDAVNRGVAAWQGRVYLGTLDGRLIALDAATGKPVWEVKTVPEGAR